MTDKFEAACKLIGEMAIEASRLRSEAEASNDMLIRLRAEVASFRQRLDIVEDLTARNYRADVAAGVAEFLAMAAKKAGEGKL